MSKNIYKPTGKRGKRLTTKEFIRRARKVHGNRYDYSKVDYKNSYTKITIICKEHGEFETTPHHHLGGTGCHSCGQLQSIKNRTCTREEFIKKARKVHGNRYDYSKLVYKNNGTEVAIICPDHGEFEQTPGNHLRGQNCPVCSIATVANSKRMTQSDFIEMAKKRHGNKYDYSKVVYKNSYTKITIICPKHGEFEQKPIKHYRGNGCPMCALSTKGGQGWDRSSDPHPGFLYFLACKLGNDYFCKIGTAYDTKKRFRAFPFEIIDSLIIPGIIGHLSIIEEKVKKDFEEYRYVPKVKFAGGKKECFQIESHRQILNYIKDDQSKPVG